MSSSSESDESLEVGVAGLHPFQFEPVRVQLDTVEGPERRPDSERFKKARKPKWMGRLAQPVKEWCQCELCENSTLVADKECRCCQERSATADRSATPTNGGRSISFNMKGVCILLGQSVLCMRPRKHKIDFAMNIL